MAGIYCENQNKKRKIDLSEIEKIAKISLDYLMKRKGEVTLVFVSNQKIRALNRKYLKKDHSTDVLSFGYKAGKDSPGMTNAFLGDIVISSDKAFQNSAKFGTTFFEEIALYVIHGILHLTGYNDINRTERKIMRRKEDDLLQEIKKKI